MSTADLNIALRAAKVRLDRAARDCLQNLPGAAERADLALSEVAALQSQLKASKGRTCAEPGCGRFTLHDRCDAHRPADVWGESRKILDQLQAEANQKGESR